MSGDSRCPVCGQKPSRSLSQNDFSHRWYALLAVRYPQDDALGWKDYCKLHFGVPILRADPNDSTFRDFYDENIKHLPYESKLKFMRYIPITSIMNTEQMSKYLDSMKSEWSFLE